MELPCKDEVDETNSTRKWNKKAAEQLEKLNKDSNLTAGLEAVLRIAVGARVMLRRNLSSSIHRFLTCGYYMHFNVWMPPCSCVLPRCHGNSLYIGMVHVHVSILEQLSSEV